MESYSLATGMTSRGNANEHEARPVESSLDGS